jgi:hypothetical protein
MTHGRTAAGVPRYASGIAVRAEADLSIAV